jgi:hypothetical protein
MYETYQDWTARWLHYYCMENALRGGRFASPAWHQIDAIDTRRSDEIAICNAAGDRLYVCPTKCAQIERKKTMGCHHIGVVNVFNHPSLEGEGTLLQTRKFQYLNPVALGENDAVVSSSDLVDFVKQVRTSIPASSAGCLERRLKFHQEILKKNQTHGISVFEFKAFVAEVLPSTDCPAQASLRSAAHKIAEGYLQDAKTQVCGKLADLCKQSKTTVSVTSHGAHDWSACCRPIKNGMMDAAGFNTMFHAVKFSGLVMDAVPDVLDFVLKMQVQSVPAGVFVVPILAPGAAAPETTDDLPCTVWVEYTCGEDAADVREHFLVYSRNLTDGMNVQAETLDSNSHPSLCSTLVNCGCGHMLKTGKIGGPHNQFNVFLSHCKAACLLSPDACDVHDLGAFGGCKNLAHWRRKWKRNAEGDLDFISDIFLRDFVSHGFDMVRAMFSARKAARSNDVRVRELVDHVMTTPTSNLLSLTGMLLISSFRCMALAWPSRVAAVTLDTAALNSGSAAAYPESNTRDSALDRLQTPSRGTSFAMPMPPHSKPVRVTSALSLLDKKSTTKKFGDKSPDLPPPPPPPSTPVLGATDDNIRVDEIQSLSSVSMRAAAHNTQTREAPPLPNLSVLAAVAVGSNVFLPGNDIEGVSSSVLCFGQQSGQALQGLAGSATLLLENPGDTLLLENPGDTWGTDASDSDSMTLLFDTSYAGHEATVLSTREMSDGIQLSLPLPDGLAEINSEELEMFDMNTQQESDAQEYVRVPRQVWEQMMRGYEQVADMVQDICGKQKAVHDRWHDGRAERKRRRVLPGEGMAVWDSIF